MSENSNNKLTDLSLSQLVIEAAQMKQLLVQLKNSNKKIMSLLSNPLIPFLAFIGDGIIKLVPEEDDLTDETLNLDNYEFRRFIGQLRVGHKLLSDKTVSKTGKLLLGIQEQNFKMLTSEYNALQKIVIDSIGQRDLSIVSYKGIDFGNLLQTYIYLDPLLKHLDEIKYSDLKTILGPKLIGTSTALSSIISSFVSPFEEFGRLKIDKLVKIQSRIKEFESKEYFFLDKVRKDIFNNTLPMEQLIVLHSHLCQLNFIGTILPEIFGNVSDLYLRFKLITYLEAVKTLKKLVNQKQWIDDFHRDDINDILNSSIYKLISKRQVRNNIAHYTIADYDYEIFKGNNVLIDIIEFESKDVFSSFWESFEEQFVKLKLVIMSLIY